MILLAIDPGIRGCGVAVFDGGWLVHADYVVNPCREGNRAAEAASMASWVHGSLWGRFDVTALALEWPRVYATRIASGASPGDPNDLLGLAAVSAGIAALYAPAAATSYCPSEWKGQMPKDVCQKRINARLNSRELAFVMAVKPAGKRHNTWDAVGIGLHHLGRLAPRRAL